MDASALVEVQHATPAEGHTQPHNRTQPHDHVRLWLSVKEANHLGMFSNGLFCPSCLSSAVAEDWKCLLATAELAVAKNSWDERISAKVVAFFKPVSGPTCSPREDKEKVILCSFSSLQGLKIISPL